MSAISPGLPSEQILESIRPFRRRILGLTVTQLSLTVLTILIGGLLAAMWLDTVWALPPSVRWWASRGGMIVAAAALVFLAIHRSRRMTHERVAHRIDDSIASGGEILAGLQLATSPVHPNGELSRGFAAMATERAVGRVRGLTLEVVSDWTGLRKAALILAAVCLAIGALSVVVPGIAWHQTQRFLYPASDIPAYTGVELELTLESDHILYGQDVLAFASVKRGRVERMSLVVRTDEGREQTMPMLAETDRRWRAILTRVTQPLTIHARSDQSRSKQHRLEVQLTPRILPPRVTITPPAYTRGGTYRGTLPEKGLVGLAGTKVAWEVSSNRPLHAGHVAITYRDGQTEQIELQPASRLSRDGGSNDDELKDAQDGSDNTVVGEMVLTKAGHFELSVVDIDGLESYERITGSITITEDRRPIVRITSPQQTSLATPDIRLLVNVMAEDDYGISSLSLFRSLNGSAATPVHIEFSDLSRVEQQWELPLLNYGLSPGDEIRLFARTEDNDPAGAKGAESPVTTVHIISVQQFQELMVQRKGAESIQAKYQAARRYFDQLAGALRDVEEAQAELAANPDSAEAAQKLQEKLAAAENAAQQAADEIDKLGEQPLPIDVDQELSKRLQEMSQDAANMARQLQQLQKNANPSLSAEDQQQLQEMLETSGALQQQLTDQAIDPLKKMQTMLPLVIDQQRFVQLTQQQRDLSERLSGLKGANPEEPATQRRIAELESEQEQLKQALGQLLNDIEQHAADLPIVPEVDQLRSTAQEFVQAVRDSQADTEMNLAQSKLLEDKFEDAQTRSAKAAEILESFLSQCEGMGNSACQNCRAAFNPSLGCPNLGNSIEQMLAMMGMKPGRSGMKLGGSPGMGFGWGAGGGYSQRFAGPQNIGMYGSLPTPQTAAGRGQSDRKSQGFQTSQIIEKQGGGLNHDETSRSGEPGGAAINSMPADYRAKVAEYFRNLSNAINDQESP
ncbi:MAG: hypothetical protein R3C05_13350 [Pirellulaceae bacterium]